MNAYLFEVLRDISIELVNDLVEGRMEICKERMVKLRCIFLCVCKELSVYLMTHNYNF